MTFKRDFKIYPGWDKRNDDPSKNYGIHGCELEFVLTGDKGVAVFRLSTDWLPLHVQQERMGRDVATHGTYGFPDVCQVVVGEQPMGADLGYHSPTPLRDWQTDNEMRKDCPYLENKPCYYDGSGLAAEEVRNIMLEKGSDGVWQALEAYYERTYNGMGDAGFGDLVNAFTEAIKEK